MRIITVLFLLIILSACNEFKQDAGNNDELAQEVNSNNELIKDANGKVLYEVYKEKINDEYDFRFLKGKLGYTLNYDAVDAETMFKERLMKGNNNKFELYYKGKRTFVDSLAFVEFNNESIESMFDFFDRDDTLMMHFFPDPRSRKQFQEISFYEGIIGSVQGYEYGPVDSTNFN